MSILKKITYCLSLLVLTILSVSCSEDVWRDGGQTETKNLKKFSVALRSPSQRVSGTITETRMAKDGLHVSASEQENEQTRVALEDVSVLTDVWVLQYDDAKGTIATCQYVELKDSAGYSVAEIEVDAAAPKSDVYFLVNSHDSTLFAVAAPYTPSQLAEIAVPVSGEHWCDSLGVPMYGVVKNVKFDKEAEAKFLMSNITLRRLVACLNVEVAVRETMTPATVQLCNVPATYNFIEGDTAATAMRTFMDFEQHDWNETGATILPDFKSGYNYVKRKFTWFIPSYNTDSLYKRTYVSCKGTSDDGRNFEYRFRLFNQSRTPKITANTVYNISDELSICEEYGDSASDMAIIIISAKLECLNVALDAAGNEVYANCYIVNTEGNTRTDFKFPVGQYGRYAEEYASAGETPPALTDALHWKAEIVWATNTENVNIKLSNTEGAGNGYVDFVVTPVAGATSDDCWANAVVAIRNNTPGSSKQILWSWHLWITPKDVTNDLVDVNDGRKVLGYALGASRSRLYDNVADMPTNVNDWGDMIGLFYQWGRKDPFRGPFGLATYLPEARKQMGNGTTVFTPSYTELSTTFSQYSTWRFRNYSIQNPGTFISSSLFKGCASASDLARYSWNTSGKYNTGKKSVFDPSPPGFMVLEDMDVLNGFVATKKGTKSAGMCTTPMMSGTYSPTSYPYWYVPIGNKYLVFPLAGNMGTDALKGTFQYVGSSCSYAYGCPSDDNTMYVMFVDGSSLSLYYTRSTFVTRSLGRPIYVQKEYY